MPPGRAGDRRLVRLGLHAGGPGGLPARPRARRRPSPSRPTSSPRPSTRPGAGSTRCWPSTPWSSARAPTATWSAWATSSTPTAARCPSRSATSSTPGRSSTPGAPTPCAGGCSARGRPGRRRGRRSCAIDTAMRDMLLTLWNTFSFFTTYASLNEFDLADAAIPAPAERGPLRPLDPVPAGQHHVGGDGGADDVRAPGGGDRAGRPRRRPLQLVRPPQPPPLLAHRPRRARRRHPGGAGDAAHGLDHLSLLLAPLCPFVVGRHVAPADRRRRRRRRCTWPTGRWPTRLRRRPGARGADGAGPPAHVARPGRPQRGLGQGAPAPASGRWCSSRPTRPRSCATSWRTSSTSTRSTPPRS